MDPKYTDVDFTLQFARQKIAAVETRWNAFRDRREAGKRPARTSIVAGAAPALSG